jgi:superfamily II DNA or RNA helicase
VFGQDHRLTISRLWSKNELQPVDGAHVVVASIQKLASIGKRPEGSFDLAPRVVVVDEAHRSNATSYIQLLRTLKPEVEDDAYTLLGLTATPFRGENEDETRRLVNRYGKNRLDLDLFGGDPLTELRRIKVLAEADHEILHTDFEIRLNDADRQHFEEFSVLPPWLEDRISLDASRTRAIVDRVLELPADWPVLVYCPSVKGADLVAAMLSLEGVEAQSISGDTPVDARRQAVKDFKSGAVRILTNYRVLTEGFDAPGARAVVISRPVFSTNLYQQIIGRGLRGPANGGKDECLIVDVADNFLHFDGQLAFHHFDYLWETLVDY